MIGREGEDLLAPAVAYEEETLRGVRRPPERAAPVVALPPELAGDVAAVVARASVELTDDQLTVVPGSVAPRSAMPARGSAAPSSVVSGPGSAMSVPVVSVDGEDEDTAFASAREEEEEARALASALVSARVPSDLAEAQGDVVSVRAARRPQVDAAVLAGITPAVPGVAPAPRRPAATLPALEYPKPERLLTLGSLPPPPVVEEPAPAALKVPAAPPAARLAAPAPAPALDESPTPRRVRRPSAYVPTPQPPARDNRTTMWVLFAVAAFVFAVAARLSRDHELQGAPPPPEQPSPAAAEPATAAPAGAAVPAVAGSSSVVAAAAVAATPAAAAAGPIGETTANPVLPENLPLAADHKVPEGQGMLEVIAGAGDTLFVDGRKVGTGSVKLPLAPKDGAYEIRAKLRDEERVRFAVVKAGRLTRLRVAPPWRR